LIAIGLSLLRVIAVGRIKDLIKKELKPIGNDHANVNVGNSLRRASGHRRYLVGAPTINYNPEEIQTYRYSTTKRSEKPKKVLRMFW